jgi:predicted nucleic acid-binding protein
MVRTYVLDSSVVVKWFKKGEDSEEEALMLRHDVLTPTSNMSASELMPLEVCRALVKVGYSPEKIDEAYTTLAEMAELGFLKLIPTAELIDEAKESIVKLNLHVADALSLAAAVVTSSDLLTEDRHLLKKEVKEIIERKELKILRLKEAYRGGFKQE